MSKKQVITPHSDAKQKQYEREARLEYGPTNVNESVKRWASYSKARQDEIMAEGGQIYLDLVEAMKQQRLSGPVDVTDILARWHQHIG